MTRAEAKTYLQKKGDMHADDLTIVSVGHLCKRKGQEYAVQAMAQLVEQVPHARLLMLGSLDRDAGYVHKIQTMIRDYNLQENISLLGFRSDVPVILQGADIFLHTAIKDTHPRAVIEAMGWGVPVVAFQTDGVAETIIQGETGFLVVQNDVSGLVESLNFLAGHPQQREMYGKMAMQRVKELFSAEQTASRIGAIIDSAL
jgi:glycosyltransferase EpsD